MAPSRQRGTDLSSRLRITLREAASGCNKTLTIKMPDGRSEIVTVKIPPGIDTGKRLRVHGKGEPGIGGLPPGDLYLDIAVEDDPVFKRDGDDLIIEKDIRFTEAVFGTLLEVPTLDGDTKKVKVPPGIKGGTKIRLKGYGIKHLNGRGRGDLYIKVNIEVPKRLNARQKKLLEELAKEGL